MTVEFSVDALLMVIIFRFPIYYNFSHRRIPIIRPYMASASANATTKKLLKKVSGFSAAALMAAVPDAEIAMPAPRQARPTAILAPKAISALSHLMVTV